MTILSIDPSITCTGWAISDGAKVLSVGKIRTNPAFTLPERVWQIMNEFSMMETREILKVKSIIIEIPSGHVNHSRNKGSGAGLSIYGFAVGAIWQWLRYGYGEQVHCVPESEWIGPRNRLKERRKQLAAMYYPEYRKLKDAGGDIADAICLGQWWHDTQRMKGQRP